MDQADANQSLVITGMPLLVGFARASVHTHRALDESSAFFRWCSDHPDAPIKDLLDLSHQPAGQQWRELIMAQSLDMFADSGMNAVNWTGTMVEALGQVSHLSSPGPHQINLDGFRLDFQRVPGPEQPSLKSPHAAAESLISGHRLPGFVSLTMADASRGLSYASAQIEQIANLLDGLNPGGTRVEHSMLASALLTLLALGPMTGYSHALVGGPADPWHALMSWDIPEDLRGPSGDQVELLHAQEG